MTQNNPDDIIKCKTCEYEFLIFNHDRCPKCGDMLRRVEKAPFIVNVRVSDSLSTEQEHIRTQKIVHYFIDGIIIFISIASIAVCYLIEPWLSVFIGIIVFIVTFYLGKKFAEKWIIEKIIERDHYH